MPCVLPLVEELTPLPEPEAVFRCLAARPHCLFLDSAMREPCLGRYSFLAADPFEFVEGPAEGTVGLEDLARRLTRWSAATVPGRRE